MTYGDLKRNIFNLNWEDESGYADNQSIISDGINRALKFASDSFPIIKQYKISQHPFKNIIKPSFSRDTEMHYDGMNKIEFSGEWVKAYIFFCDGIGTAVITDDNGAITIELDGNKSYKLYKGFATGNVLIEFSGEFSYNVKGVCMYGEKISNSLEDILPFANQVRYDFFELLKDKNGISQFVEFSDKLTETNEIKTLNNFSVEKNAVLVLDGSFKGEFLIGYKRKPQVFDTDTKDDVLIEFDEKAVDLLPLLAAYFIWLDDERSRAQEYYNQYEMQRDRILKENQGQKATVIIMEGKPKWI